jgi:hypothetical protein
MSGGVAEASVGVAFTVNAFVFVTVPPSGLSTVKLRAPTAASAVTDRSIVRWELSMTANELIVRSVLETETVAPGWKPVPVRVTA